MMERVREHLVEGRGETADSMLARRGLGLGLYICERIVEAHGGRICVESEFGNWAAFHFTLPTSEAAIKHI